MQTFPNGTKIAAPILCQTDGCARDGDEINRVTMNASDEDLFYMSFGHGGEEPADYCPVCGKLGLLQDPEPVAKEKR